MQDEQNPRNKLAELLKALGWPEDAIGSNGAVGGGPPHEAEVYFSLAELGIEWTARAEARRLKQAELAAFAVLLDRLGRERPELLAVDWDAVRSEAQAGDALLKLAFYAEPGGHPPWERSGKLNEAESDRALSEQFERLRQEVDWLRIFGPELGTKKRATLTEAVIWRRHGADVLDRGARGVLAALRAEFGA